MYIYTYMRYIYVFDLEKQRQAQPSGLSGPTAIDWGPEARLCVACAYLVMNVYTLNLLITGIDGGGSGHSHPP